MTDIKVPLLPAGHFHEGQLREAIEMLFFAYRDFTSEPDALLAGQGFGRAHHRVIYFVGRHPGMTVSELLGILRITKQSLARVLRELVDQGFVAQAPGERDKRQRRLSLTSKGLAFERALTERQLTRIAKAYAAAGPQAVEGFRKTLLAITDDPSLGRKGMS
ncbi:MAG: MarR family transcriptional regulator [Alphaproteobacteria bacterium]|nr:MarR family transcriptional regulator [Alphaproteobacteria bacterium]